MAKSIFEQIVDKSITSISAEDLKGAKNIGITAFRFCDYLTDIVIPNGVTSIGYGAFISCRRLTNVIIPSSVTSIEGSAFNLCGALISITIPENVNNIGGLAFANTTGSMKITDVYFKQPSGMVVTLPTAGSAGGMFYVKTARSMNIYTDNETIKNYAWATDNITPTFYHLDGTAW